ncbi:MAG: DUF4330 family protein [Eubacteriales bacterium]|jgi:hypothetical protein
MGHTISDERRRKTEEDKPLRRRINALDIIFIIVILLAALFVASFFTPLNIFGSKSEQRTISYTVEIEGIEAGLADSVRGGDLVFDSVSKSAIGVVTAVKKSDMVKYVYNPELGVLEAVVYPQDNDQNTPKTLIITIQATADYRAGSGYRVKGSRISVGSPVTLCFPGFTGTGNCVVVYVVDGAEEAGR